MIWQKWFRTLLLCGMVLFGNTLSAGDQELDISRAEIFRSDIRKNKNIDNFNVALFLARDTSVLQGNPGHAYVATARWDDRSGGYWVDTWIFGMYPKTSKDGFKSFFVEQGVQRGREVDAIRDKEPEVLFRELYS